MTDSSPSNTLGLDFSTITLDDQLPPSTSPKETNNGSDSEPKQVGQVIEQGAQSPSAKTEPSITGTNTKEKKKPYVNPDRVKTGGSQRDKLSEEALTERMARMREQNEKIKQRRQDVKADEEAFKKTQEIERIKQVESRKKQEDVNRARDQNAKRKMEKAQSREWDSGKQTNEFRPNANVSQDKLSTGNKLKGSSNSVESSGNTGMVRARDASSRGSRGRGRGRGGNVGGREPRDDQESSQKSIEAADPVSSLVSVPVTDREDMAVVATMGDTAA